MYSLHQAWWNGVRLQFNLLRKSSGSPKHRYSRVSPTTIGRPAGDGERGQREGWEGRTGIPDSFYSIFYLTFL